MQYLSHLRFANDIDLVTNNPTELQVLINDIDADLIHRIKCIKWHWIGHIPRRNDNRWNTGITMCNPGDLKSEIDDVNGGLCFNLPHELQII